MACLAESVNAELLSIVAEARGVCSCSNSRVGGGGAHEPHCLSERATRMHSSLVPAKCARCIAIEPDPPLGVYRTRDGGWLCPSCAADDDRNRGLGAWLRELMFKSAKMPAFQDLTATEIVALIRRHLARS